MLLRRQLSQDTHAGQCAAKGFPSTWCSLAIQLDLGTILKLDAKLQGDLAAPWPRHPTAIDHFCRRTPYYSSHTILNLHFCSCLQAYSRAKLISNLPFLFLVSSLLRVLLHSCISIRSLREGLQPTPSTKGLVKPNCICACIKSRAPCCPRRRRG